MDLLPDSLRSVAAKRLVDRLEANHWRLGTGSWRAVFVEAH